MAFLLDSGFKAIQILVGSCFISAFIKAQPRWRFVLAFALPMIAINVLSNFAGDYVLIVRPALGLIAQLLAIVFLRRIPLAHALVYYAMANVLMFAFELPLDIFSNMLVPEYMVLTRVPPNITVVFNILYFPFLVASYAIAYVICNRLFRMEDLQEYRYYVPFIVILCLEINFPMSIILTFADWDLRTALIGTMLLLIHTGMIILLAFTFRRIQHGAEAEIQARRMEESLTYQISYYDQIYDHIGNVRIIKEDMQRQLQNALNLMENEHTDSSKQQIKDALQFIDLVSYSRYTGNAVADAVLSAKRTKCQTEGIPLEVEGQLPDDLHIRGIDICSLFSNILDNAIQSCERLPKGTGWIHLRVLYQHPLLRIICENPVKETLSQYPAENIRYEHGWGLSILRGVAENYRGSMEISQNSNVIQTLLWLYAKDGEGRLT